MVKFARVLFISILLLAFVVYPTLPNLENLEPNKIEKLAEQQYIYQDALITTEFALTQLISNLEKRLSTLEPNEEVSVIKQEFPEVVNIKARKVNKPFRNYKPFPATERISREHISFNKGRNIAVNIPIKDHQTFIEYEVIINSDVFNHIIKKQELRMKNIIFLQNNRWKTNPTKYQPGKKKLSLGMEQAIPDINPDENEKGLSHYIQNEIIVKFHKTASEDYINELLKKYDISVKKRLDHTIVAHCDKKSTKNLLSLLEIEAKQNSYIDYVEPHFIYLTNKDNIGHNSQNQYTFTPNDILYSKYQWNLPIIDTEKGWKFTKGKEDIIIAVIDTGVDLHHPEFQDKLIDGTNIVKPNEAPLDDDGHGTHVAGIISANTNNQEGIAGITWYNQIMPIKVLDQSGAGTLFDVAEGIIWATDHGAKVINLSLGNYAKSKYLHDAIKYAYSKDVVLVAATGNDNTDELGYPAAYEEVLAVSAIDPYRERANFSNYGTYVDVVAPGVNIPSTYPSNQYAALSGTSMASPHVAALAGLIRSINPRLSNTEVSTIIKKTAIDLGPEGKDHLFGYGQINIEKAIELAEVEVNKGIWIPWFKKLFGQNKSIWS